MQNVILAILLNVVGILALSRAIHYHTKRINRLEIIIGKLNDEVKALEFVAQVHDRHIRSKLKNQND